MIIIMKTSRGYDLSNKIKITLIFASLIILLFVLTQYRITNIALKGISMVPTYQNGENVLFLNKRKNRLVAFGDVVRVDKFTHGKNEVQYVKRVMGLPGDTILMHINGYIVSINGVKPEYKRVADGQTYLYQTELQQDATKDVDFSLLDKDEIVEFASVGTEFVETIGEEVHNVVLLVGNRHDTKREYIEHLKNSVQSSNVKFDQDGLSRIVVPSDYYFVLSDNRPIGVDSRYFGFAQKSNISAVLP